MSALMIHGLAPLVASGWVDTGKRLTAAVPSHSAQMSLCRAINLDPAYAFVLRVAANPSVWALLTPPSYAGQSYTERALLP